MRGLMQERPLLVSGLITYAERYHGETEIISRLPDRSVHRSDWRGIGARSRRLANALARLGLGRGDRVATLAWNSFRHMELYFGVAGSGGVLHTVNPRLFPEQIQYIIDHAESGYVFFDLTFAPLVEKLAPLLPGVRGWVALCEEGELAGLSIPRLLCYEALLAAESDVFTWPELDERDACALCYTSGTTGHPKGVLYSHRSQVLHAMAACSLDALSISSRDSILLVVPLFHANAWGVPFSAAMSGAKLVLPGSLLDGESIYNLLRDEGCNFSMGVPTVWLGFFDYIERNRATLDLSALKLERVAVGGSAAPRAIIEKFQTLLGTFLIHAWGMTETSPLGAVCNPLPKHRDLPASALFDLQTKQGRPIYGAELRILGPDGTVQPHDGVAVGDLQIRGNWIVSAYFKADGPATDADGWFTTGDVAKIDPDGYVQLTDRSKDVIKSGGEWISSIDVENIAVGHPDVQEAAVIGVYHPKWQERPLLLIHCKPGRDPSKADILGFLEGKIAKWWTPDDVVFVDSLPHTATGKLLKIALRETYRDHLAGAK
jgi:fatty-acyl-CoA synthase